MSTKKVDLKKSKKDKESSSIEGAIATLLLSGVSAANIIEKGYARSTVYKIRKEIEERTIGSGSSVATLPLAVVNHPLYPYIRDMQKELTKLREVAEEQLNIMKTNHSKVSLARDSRKDEEMRKNVAVVMKSMVPPDVVNAMPPHLRKAFDAMLGMMAPPNDPIWDNVKPDPREPNPRDSMTPMERLGDTIERTQKGIKDVGDILYGDSSKGKASMEDFLRMAFPNGMPDNVAVVDASDPKSVDKATKMIQNEREGKKRYDMLQEGLITALCWECKKQINPRQMYAYEDEHDFHMECYHKYVERHQDKDGSNPL